jgi:hypothetical protein
MRRHLERVATQHAHAPDRFAPEIVPIFMIFPTLAAGDGQTVRQRLSLGRRPYLFMLVAHVA